MATPNMNLSLPTVSTTPGPQWASDINTALSTVDSHNHTSGNGVQIPSSGININGDLTFNSYNATTLRSVRFASNPSVLSLGTDLGCLYNVNGNLYWNSGAGAQVQLTIGGALNATSIGGIGGDYATSTASVFYTSLANTFTFWRSNNVNATLDVGSVKVRFPSAGAFYVGLNASNSMATNIDLTLPVALPASQSFMTLDSGGNIAAPWTVDGTSIKIVSNQLTASVVSGEHAWELNGAYAALSYPQNDIDSTFFAPYNLTITGIWIYTATNGTTGTTEFDLKYKTSPSGSWATIFSTTGKIAATTTLSAGALTSSGTVATVALNGHGFVTGDSITIAGATPAGYNGTFTVTGFTTNSFTYTVPSGLATPATGTITLRTRTGAYTDSGSLVASQAGVTKPVLSVTNISAGSVIRWDLLTSMNTGATDAHIRIYYIKA